MTERETKAAAIPSEIVNRGDDAVTQWWVATSASGSEPLNEVKVLVLGDGGVGKTSLVRRLTENSFDSLSSMTSGIEVRHLNSEISGREFNLNVWDFGGQEIFHSTHQLFLSRRSIYVIVLSARNESDPHYWLEIATAYGGTSPVLVVINKSDEYAFFALDEHRLRREYPNIIGFHRTSCSSGHGIASVREAILVAVHSLSHFQNAVPTSWMRLRRRLGAINEQYLDQDDFSLACNEVGIVDQAEQTAVLRFLNDLGIVVYFPEVALQVLSPNWVTSAIYRIINSEVLQQSHGVLSLSSLKEILASEESTTKYNANERRAVVEIMKRFELCYDEVPYESVLFPGHLPVEEPKFDFEVQNAIHLRFDFAFLPSSVFPRILVRLKDHLEYDQRWRHGAVAHSRGYNAQILVRHDLSCRHLEVWIQGAEPWPLCDVFCSQVLEITSRLHGFEVYPVVPCLCSTCITARRPNLHYLRSLVARLRDGANCVVCELSDHPVSLSDLLPRHPLLNTIWVPNLVFVSYSSKDRDVVLKIVSDMRARGIPYWVDSERIGPGDSVTGKLDEGLQSCTVLLACLSQNQLQSGWARAEYGSALASFHSDSGKRVIPVILDDMSDKEIPPLLRDLHAVRYSDIAHYRDLMNRLLTN